MEPLKRASNPPPEWQGALNGLERKYDMQFEAVFSAIRELMQEDNSRRRREIGSTKAQRCHES